MQDDHFNVSDHLNGIASHSDELAAVIEREGVPLASKQNPYGALLMAAPLPHQGGAYYGTCLALIAPSDQQRDAWFQLLQERISRVTVSHR